MNPREGKILLCSSDPPTLNKYVRIASKAGWGEIIPTSQDFLALEHLSSLAPHGIIRVATDLWGRTEQGIELAARAVKANIPPGSVAIIDDEINNPYYYNKIGRLGLGVLRLSDPRMIEYFLQGGEFEKNDWNDPVIPLH